MRLWRHCLYSPKPLWTQAWTCTPWLQNCVNFAHYRKRSGVRLVSTISLSHTHHWLNERKNEWLSEWMTEWLVTLSLSLLPSQQGWLYQGGTEWISKWTNKWMIHDMRVGKLSGCMGQADEYNHGRVIGSDDYNNNNIFPPTAMMFSFFLGCCWTERWCSDGLVAGFDTRYELHVPGAATGCRERSSGAEFLTVMAAGLARKVDIIEGSALSSKRLPDLYDVGVAIRWRFVFI